MRLDKNSHGTVAFVWLAGGTLILLSCLLFHNIGVKIAVALPFTAFILFATWFHRVPDRPVPDSDKIVTSVADGKVVILEKVMENEYFRDERIQVSVYMDFFNVHANFWPVSGKISYYRYHPGYYFLAFLPKASEKNEHSTSVIRTPYGEVMFRQIAGTFARRIVCYSKKGGEVVSGEQCGIIKFGSRIDFFLPLDADIKVKKGDMTRACETVIADLSPCLHG